MATPVVALKRRTIDEVLVGLGTVVTVVLVVAGGLLMWGRNFAGDHVKGELTDQKIFFNEAAALTKEGRGDLAKFAGVQVTTGNHAKAYASYIKGHLDKVAGGKTYAELGTPERAAQAAVKAAKDSGAAVATVTELQAKADGFTAQRNTLFKGETLRGLLLTAYAWSTIGRIAGIAAVVAFIGAAAMLALVVAGGAHLMRNRRAG